MTSERDSRFIRKAITLLITKDASAAVCDVHIPLVESLEIGVGRAIPTREPLTFPTACAMCAALVFQEEEPLECVCGPCIAVRAVREGAK